MGRYTGPKGRINRRLGTQVFENSGALKALEKRDYPPGMAQRRRKVSNYGLALSEKQKIKFYYGLRDQQLYKYFDKARRMKGNTGEQLLILCERRLDNVVRRAGFTATRPQARQGITHSHFQVNGVTVNKPSILVRPGDVITVRKRPNLRKMYEGILESSGSIQPTDWINFDAKELTAIVTTLPMIEDVSLPVDVGQVVAFMSR
jgi:small subunit ribosomal protein S4